MGARPTRTRYWVVVFAITLAVIQYIDRVCISQAAPNIQRDLRLPKEEMGWVFGAGEAGCFPNLTRAFDSWLPLRERIRAQGIMWMSARWGGAATPYLVFLVLGFVHWRTAFLLFGALGVGWAVLFYHWFRDHPRDHKGVNE